MQNLLYQDLWGTVSGLVSSPVAVSIHRNVHAVETYECLSYISIQTLDVSGSSAAALMSFSR